MNEVKQKMLGYISAGKQATVRLEQLEQWFAGEAVEYEVFAEAVQELEREGVLSEVKTEGRTGRSPDLARRYRIERTKLRGDFQLRVHRLRLELHPLISLDRYFSLGEVALEQDIPYLRLIDSYLKEHGLPHHIVAAPERSYAIVQDEKWITDNGGRALLTRIGLWDRLMVAAEYDPLMMAVNPEYLASLQALPQSEPCLHLIVENKTTFQALLPALPDTVFHTLIYGCGNKITGNIEMFPKQYPLPDRKHQFYYFGDIDHKGIQIWSDLARKVEAVPALAFYRACIAKAPAVGKEYQRPNTKALSSFTSFFSERDKTQMEHCLSDGQYYPQETLSTRELQAIWRDTPWN
ncbi:DUF2220 family protein [Paenibacillus sp. BR2-3]|uniref:Wadjet anti-phage system protein JetD domain-containing protein n=1 Tax=Paenibacillus sp. BR2-3 TaxID=3048494 RepID=UPI003977CE3D